MKTAKNSFSSFFYRLPFRGSGSFFGAIIYRQYKFAVVFIPTQIGNT